ncbi:MAG: alpha-galactosidase [Myxococcaceae bacterium]
MTSVRALSSAAFLLLAAACPPPPPQPAPPLVLEVSAETGGFSLTRAGIGLKDVRPSVTVNGAELMPAAGAPATLETSEVENALWGGHETRIISAVSGFRVTTTLLQTGQEQFTARVSIACDGPCPAAQPTVQGLALAGTATSPAEVGEPTAAFSHGYQSWSPTFIASVQRTTEAEASFEDTGNDGQHLLSDARVSWWVSFLAYPGAAVVTGALTAEHWKTRVLTYRRDGVQWRLSSGRTGDELRLGPARAEASSEAFFLGVFDTPQAGLSRYGDEVARLNPPLGEPFIPVGWNSWNTLFEEVTEQKVFANAAALSAALPGLAPNTVQIDDGWEKGWGDWTANAKFPSGMQGVASRLTAQGLHPGLWMAPFLVDAGLPLTAAHPDWFLKNSAGAFVAHGDANGHSRYVIDASHPAAREWLLAQVRGAMTQGFRYLKLDFLYAGADEGVRFDRELTGVEAYRSVMKQIAQEAGQSGVYLLACGAPVLPTAGVAHGIRTGEDIAAMAAPYGFAWVKNAARNVSYRFFVNRFLASDPDTTLLRGLPENEQRLQLTATLLAGRLFSLGDDLEGLPAADADLLARASRLPMPAHEGDVSYSEGFVPMDYLGRAQPGSMSKLEILAHPDSYGVPSTWRLAMADGSVLVALLNWSSTEGSFPLTLEELGKPAAATATELWTGDAVPASGGKLERTVPAHSAALLRVH